MQLISFSFVPWIWLTCISTGPENGTVLLRKSEWEKSKSEWNVYVAAEAIAKMGRETRVLNAAAPEQPPATTSEQGESAEPALRRDVILTVSSVYIVPLDCQWV